MSFALMVAHAAEVPPPKFALVIGNANYPGKARLANPVSDAELMAETFRQLGYQTTLLKNADRAAMIRAVAQLADALHGGGVAALYFSGHGLQLGGADFLLPVGLPPLTQNLLRNDAYPLQLALDRLHNSGAQVSLIIVDACRNVPYGWGYRTLSEQGLAEVNPAEGMLIAFATAPGELALDGKPGSHHSPFTAALAQAMETPNLTIDQVFAQVRAKVRQQTKDEQQPWVNTSLVGDFSFRPPANVVLQLATAQSTHGKLAGVSRQSPGIQKNPITDLAEEPYRFSPPPLETWSYDSSSLSGFKKLDALLDARDKNQAMALNKANFWGGSLSRTLTVQFNDLKNTENTLTPNDLPVLIADAQYEDVNAQTVLGFAYRDGLLVQSRSNPNAVKWFRAAAHQGFAIAENELGVMYYEGLGVDKNVLKAEQWFEAASKAGYIIARINLIQAQAGNDPAKLANLMSTLYRLTPPKDKNQTVTLTKVNAEESTLESNGLQNTASSITENALPELLNEAKAGDVIAQTILGFAYRDALPPQWRSNSEAVKWFRVAAHQGDAMSQNELGEMYYEGIGVKSDVKKAEKWFETASKQGNFRAQINLFQSQAVNDPVRLASLMSKSAFNMKVQSVFSVLSH
jgi:TPR repeat protein